MPDETPFRIGLVISLLPFLVVRAYYRVKTRTLGKGSFPQDNKLVLTILLIILVLTFFAILTWLIQPDWIKWSALPLPQWIRWSGVILALASTPLLIWVHHTLGASYSAKLEIKSQHKLITTGPYRWVRHPMYSAIFLWTVGLSLIIANCMTFLAPVAFALFVILRMPDEEQMMVEAYGDLYREHMKQTGRLLPRWPDLRKRR